MHRRFYSAFVDELIKIAASGIVGKLQPGDIIITSEGSKSAWKGRPIRGTLQSLTSKLMKLPLGEFGHAGIYSGDGKIIDAHPAYGVSEKPFDDVTQGVGVVAFRPDLPQKDREEAVDRARSRIGKAEYSVKEVLRAGAGMISEKVPVRDRRKRLRAVMCSGLVNDAYMGKAAPKHPDITTPPDLAKSPLLQPIAMSRSMRRYVEEARR